MNNISHNFEYFRRTGLIKNCQFLDLNKSIERRWNSWIDLHFHGQEFHFIDITVCDDIFPICAFCILIWVGVISVIGTLGQKYGFWGNCTLHCSLLKGKILNITRWRYFWNAYMPYFSIYSITYLDCFKLRYMLVTIETDQNWYCP